MILQIVWLAGLTHARAFGVAHHGTKTHWPHWAELDAIRAELGYPNHPRMVP